MEGAVNQRVASAKVDKKGIFEGDLTFYKKVQAGDDSLLSVGATEGKVEASDTLFTDTYYSYDLQSVQLNVAGGTTVRVQAQVMTANTGADYSAISLPQANFQIFEWVVMGTGVAGNYVKTSQDSILATGRSTPIRLYLPECEVWQLMFITSQDHVGTTTISGTVLLKEDY